MIVITPITESTRFALGVNVILKSDFSMKVKGNTKRRIQMKKELAQGKKNTISSLNSREGTKGHINRVLDKGTRHNYQQQPIYVTAR